MRSMMAGVLIVGIAAAAFGADALAGRKITVTGGDAASSLVPVCIPYDGAAGDKAVAVADAKGGKTYPATVRDGQLVFVLDSLGAKEVRTLEVKTAASEPQVALAKVDGKDEITVTINGEHFTTYHYSNDSKKPFLWPVYCEGGAGITRDWPMGASQGVEDHPHHKSIWTAYGDLNGVDCWGEGENSGYQHSGEVTFGSGGAYGWIRAKNVWQDKDHKPVVDEAREYRFYASPAAARLFDETVTFTAPYGEVKFGDTKEGGIFAFRIRPEIQADKGGKIVLSTGASGEANSWGKPAAWCDYFGELSGVGVRGIAVFDDASNLRHPTSWHVRAYGLNGANCFGLSYFTEKDQKAKGQPPLNGDYVLKAGETLTFKYRAMIHSGDSESAQVAAHFADFAAPPKAEWAKK